MPALSSVERVQGSRLKWLNALKSSLKHLNDWNGWNEA
jgi:hypothetical protein